MEINKQVEILFNQSENIEQFLDLLNVYNLRVIEDKSYHDVKEHWVTPKEEINLLEKL